MKRIACLFVFLPISLLADTIQLKNGRQFSGKTVRNNPEFITIENENGQLTFPKKEIKKVIYNAFIRNVAPRKDSKSSGSVKKHNLPLTPDLTQEEENFIFQESGLFQIEAHQFHVRANCQRFCRLEQRRQLNENL